MAGVTLRHLRDAHPRLFYQQTWLADEPFMDAPLETPLPGVPLVLACRGDVPPPTRWDLPRAVQLAELYVRTHGDPVWRNYLWTADVDTQGQRVYVGVNGQGLEIHRHLAISDRWCVPLW